RASSRRDTRINAPESRWGPRSTRLTSISEGEERLLEAGHGRACHAGADLADAREAMRDAGIDGRGDAAFDHAAHVDSGRRAGEFERRNAPFRVARGDDLA